MTRSSAHTEKSNQDNQDLPVFVIRAGTQNDPVFVSILLNTEQTRVQQIILGATDVGAKRNSADAPTFVKLMTQEIQRFLQGEVPAFDRTVLAWDEVKGFSRKILKKTAEIPWGTTCSYGQLAQRVGCPGGARAAGNALGRNPWPLVIPCHRILPANGGLGGFSAGRQWKRRFLRLESSLPEDYTEKRVKPDRGGQDAGTGK